MTTLDRIQRRTNGFQELVDALRWTGCEHLADLLVPGGEGRWRMRNIIYIYIHINIGNRKKNYTFIPTTLFRDRSLFRMSDHETGLSGWKCTFFFPISNIYITLYFNVWSTLVRKNRNTDFLYIHIALIWTTELCLFFKILYGDYIVISYSEK